MNNEPIEKIRKTFQREWLLIAVTKMDDRRTLPLEGQLIAHSPDRETIYQTLRQRKGGLDLVVFSTDALPPDYRAVF